MAEMVTSLTGLDFDVERLKRTGERIFNLKRLFNIKMGLNQFHDELPHVILEELSEGVARGKSPDFEKLKSHYYKVRDWDPKTGIPREKKLKELNLNDLQY